ncbi:NAD(P)/FAD-dependent oxidoreductase [Pseudoroseomonas wenyumeiae]|uniref:NAD(P)/FAD-dependent oxidoreductase n=1 Tax=Teichococcus wenyumeiae TaxID=2478470 RepID=A0A3A9JNY2_9PROT|nr:NAD(P)/FAD-dependent oxidoreductase [Pseudoroseomonas wenyumeiae]RKK06245.1 NAD(P)/FAD-dependent oxidoreductase [Pseudoroseomonas wenyumeiae]RMI19745.1 NAD(P)/FAD-dependent oxidoreductase [Pseudoroseomonas wenyumeiae]
MTETAESLAGAWLATLAERIAQGDAAGAASLFAAESYWRDLLPFTWSVVTLEGPDQIRAMLEETLPRAMPTAFRLEPGSARQQDGVTEAWFRFETGALRARGHLRLKDGRCWTLLTAALELKGHEEKAGRAREMGVRHGAVPGRKSWLEQRREEHSALGTTRQPEVLIVGGGQGGIVLGARLRRLGVPALIIDALPRPGDAWRRRYRTLCLHDPVWNIHLPYLPFPDHWPVFTPKDQMGDWLEAYAGLMELDIWSSTRAEGARYDAARGEWEVGVVRDGVPVTLRPKQLVLATGMSGAPQVPAYEGAESFQGVQCHSSAYRGGEAYAGKRCVVIGSNNSAHDIAAELWECGAQVTMVQRSSTLVVRAETQMRHFAYKLYSEDALEAGIGTEQADFIAASRPYALLPAMHRAIYNQIRQEDAEFYRQLEEAGFMLDFGEDESGLSMKYLRRGSGYYIDVGASDLIIRGEIKLKSRVKVSRILPEGVALDDGTVLPADLIVYATGFEPMESWISQLISEDTASRVGHVWGLGSGTRRDPGPWSGELRNMWKPTRQEGLWLQGGNLAQVRFYSRILALQLKARMEGIPTPVHDPKVFREAMAEASL